MAGHALCRSSSFEPNEAVIQVDQVPGEAQHLAFSHPSMQRGYDDGSEPGIASVDEPRASGGPDR